MVASGSQVSLSLGSGAFRSDKNLEGCIIGWKRGDGSFANLVWNTQKLNLRRGFVSSFFCPKTILDCFVLNILSSKEK